MPLRHDHIAWTPAEVARLAALSAQGQGRYDVADALNAEFHDGKSIRTPEAVSLRRSALGVKVTKAKERRAAPVTAVPAADPLEWLERLRPIAVPAPARPRASVTPDASITIVAGDFHFGAHDEAANAVLVETCRQLKPARVILNGDLPDLLAVSKYPQDARKRHSWTLQDEAAAMHRFLRELEAAVPATTEIVETEANHSGNGTASRWWRYLSDRVPALMAFPAAEEKMSYQAWWYPEWSRLRLVESVVIANDLLVLHGDIVRKHAAYSARATMEKWASSVMHSHTHRLGMGAQRVPAIPGRVDALQRFYEIGCQCSLEPSYASAPNWTQGFAIVHESAEDYAVELVAIRGGSAVVASLGETVKAA